MTEPVTVTEVAPGLHRLALPLGIHGVATVSAYLFAGSGSGNGGGDTLVDCGVAAAPTPDGDPGPDGTAALEAALAGCGSAFERVERLVGTPPPPHPLRPAGGGGRGHGGAPGGGPRPRARPPQQ